MLHYFGLVITIFIIHLSEPYIIFKNYILLYILMKITIHIMFYLMSMIFHLLLWII